MIIKKIDFKGNFCLDGFWGGDMSKGWLVSTDVYKKLKGVNPDKSDILENGKVFLDVTSLFDSSNDGKKQKVKIIIENLD